MIGYVITIDDDDRSKSAAQRCIDTAASFGLVVKNHSAYTPRNCDPVERLQSLGISSAGFYEKYSRYENAIAAFLSHYSLWERCWKSGEPLFVFEHDAVVLAPVPKIPFKGLMSIGAPSYGKYNDPLTMGVNPLTSKPYLPGAHAYAINPFGAKAILDEIHNSGQAGPTDVFLNINRFPWLQEYYPWPVHANDSFSTIQKREGCLAKHNFNKAYTHL